jgi:hypothetical protein
MENLNAVPEIADTPREYEIDIPQLLDDNPEI